MTNQSSSSDSSKPYFFLSMFTCLTLDFPHNTTSENIDCSTKEPDVCVKCQTVGSFITGESISDVAGTGHIIAILFWLVVVFIAIFGVVTNIIIILVLKRRAKKEKQFDYLVSFLAVFDIFACVAATLSSSSIIMRYQGWSSFRGLLFTYFNHLSASAALFAHSLSSHLTVLINIHCYLGIAYPLSSRKWMNWKSIRMVPLITLLITIILNTPRLGIVSIEKNVYNEDGLDIPILRGMEYIPVRREKWWYFWYVTMFTLFEHLDITFPLIIMVVLNFLSYLKVNELQKTRKVLSPTQAKEMQPVKMFLPVVTFLLCSKVGPIIILTMGHIKGVIYRELVVTLSLAIVLNSSANFVIYYWRGETFRKDTNKLLSRLLAKERFNSMSSEMSGTSK